MNPAEDRKVSTGDRLATDRTWLAHERTMLAWIRTATGLITFGFTIYKFFQLEHDKMATPLPRRWFGTREFAIIMIGIGLTALLLAAIGHVRNLRILRAEFGHAPRSLAAALGVLIAILGTIGMLAVIFHL